MEAARRHAFPPDGVPSRCFWHRQTAEGRESMRAQQFAALIVFAGLGGACGRGGPSDETITAAVNSHVARRGFGRGALVGPYTDVKCRVLDKQVQRSETSVEVECDYVAGGKKGQDYGVFLFVKENSGDWRLRPDF